MAFGVGSEAVYNIDQLTHLGHHTAFQPGFLGIAELDPEYCEARDGFSRVRAECEFFPQTTHTAEWQRQCYTNRGMGDTVIFSG